MSAGGASPNSAMHGGLAQNGHQNHHVTAVNSKGCDFQMPLHYPRYKKSDYEKMPEWQVDRLLNEYGLPVAGDIDQKRKFAMGAFLWPDQF